MTWHDFGNTFYFGFDSFFNTPQRRASQVALVVKNLPASAGVWSQVGKIPWGREWLSIQILLPGKFLRQKSLVGYSPWGCTELDTTEYQCPPTNHTPEKPPKISSDLREAQSSSLPAKNLPRNKPSSLLGPNLQLLLFPVEKSMSCSDLASNTNAYSSSGCPSPTAGAGCQAPRKEHLGPQ